MTELQYRPNSIMPLIRNQVTIVSLREWIKHNFLLLVVLGIDLLTPFFIWQRIVPGAARWLSDLALATMLFWVLARMLVFDRIPLAFWLVAVVTLVGSIMAMFEGQSVAATLWGWWVLFRYPMVWLYLYVQPYWPKNFPRLLLNFSVGVLAFEVLFQLGQFATGHIPNDDLAGTFGRHGVGPLVMFILFTLCLALGKWLATGEWKTLLAVLIMGGISSALGEMKVYPFAAAGLSVAAFFVHMIRGGQFRRLLLYAVLFVLLAGAFVSFYNTVIVESRGIPPIEAYLDPDRLEGYLNNTSYDSTTGRHYIGRGFALQLGWNTIQRDVPTFIFGMGLGTRGESQALGIAGQGLLQGYYGLISGTTLLVMMQELGIFGLLLLAAFVGWVVLTLLRSVRQEPDSPNSVLRYAVLLFTMSWPFWIYYHQSWNFSVMMLMYGTALAYVLRVRPGTEVVDNVETHTTEPVHSQLAS